MIKKGKTNKQRAQHNRNLSDASMSTFLSTLKYKCDWYGIECKAIGQFQASTSVCHKCGKKYGRMDTKIRRWTCPNCHSRLDRDINAAKVIDQIAFGNAD